LGGRLLSIWVMLKFRIEVKSECVHLSRLSATDTTIRASQSK
jgi:hypothetical protein